MRGRAMLALTTLGRENKAENTTKRQAFRDPEATEAGRGNCSGWAILTFKPLDGELRWTGDQRGSCARGGDTTPQ